MEPPVLQFETPSSLLVCGPSNSGKTSFVERLLENASLMFKTPPKSILYCYGSVWQPIFDEMEKCVKNIRFFKGLPTEDEFLDIRDSGENSICRFTPPQHDNCVFNAKPVPKRESNENYKS